MDLSTTFLALDLELAHADPRSICALGAVAVSDGEILWETRAVFRPIGRRVTFNGIHGLTWQDLADAPGFDLAWPTMAPTFSGFDTWVAHNAAFERKVLRAACRHWQLSRPRVRWLCTMSLAARALGPQYRSLPAVCARIGIPLRHHDPVSDARAAARIVLSLAKQPAVEHSAGADLAWHKPKGR